MLVLVKLGRDCSLSSRHMLRFVRLSVTACQRVTQPAVRPCRVQRARRLTEDGAVYTWGRGDDGRLGHGDNGWKYVPRIVEALEGQRIVQVAVGSTTQAGSCMLGNAERSCAWNLVGDF